MSWLRSSKEEKGHVMDQPLTYSHQYSVHNAVQEGDASEVAALLLSGAFKVDHCDEVSALPGSLITCRQQFSAQSFAKRQFFWIGFLRQCVCSLQGGLV